MLLRLKEATGLTSNYVVRAIARVAASFGKKNPPNTQGTIGVDLGINRVATTSTKGPISGKKLNRKREKMSRVRSESSN